MSDRRDAWWLLALAAITVWVAAMIGCSARQVSVWRSDLTLWAHAATIAPAKPRVALNYGVALFADGQTRAGIEQWRRASQLAHQPHILGWDRARAHATVAANISALMDAANR